MPTNGMDVVISHSNITIFVLQDSDRLELGVISLAVFHIVRKNSKNKGITTTKDSKTSSASHAA